MAKPNYQFEKRQRENEKKRKKLEKAQRKATPGRTEPDTEGVAAPAPAAAPDTPPAG